MITLQAKVAIVTGAAHGIGRATAELLSQAGAHVIIADVDEAAGEAVAAGLHGGLFVRADVSVETDVKRVVDRAAAFAGRIDVLCNNAAYLGAAHASLEATSEEWQHCFSISLLGAQYFTRAVLPYMLRHKSGSIINISSVQGMVGARNSVAYTSIKHALIGFTRSVAYDYGSYNIRANRSEERRVGKECRARWSPDH